MSDKKPSTENTKEKKEKAPQDTNPLPPMKPEVMPEEFGGTDGPEPTRYGDWENKGRCTDF